MERVLIVGNGYAGLAAARVLAGDPRRSITVVSAEAYPAYCLHRLPEVAAGMNVPDDLRLTEPGEYESLGVALKAGAGVERLSAPQRKAVLSTGEELPFDKALLATGARPYIPEALAGPASRGGNVFPLRRMDDALALRRLIEAGAKSVVIIGAGRIGVLLAEALADRPVTVTVVDLAPQILATMLSADVAARLRPELESRERTRVLTGSGVERIAEENGGVREVGLSDGTRISCDAVVIAAGVAPNVGTFDGVPASADGVLVNRKMETGADGIYAAGDVVAFETVTGRIEPGQLIINARLQGDVAARNIAGGNALCPPSFTGNVVKIGRLTGARVGEIGGTGRADLDVGESFVRLTLEGSAVTGLQFVGRAEDLRGLVPAVLNRFDAAEILALARGGMSLGLAPLLASRSIPWA